MSIFEDIKTGLNQAITLEKARAALYSHLEQSENDIKQGNVHTVEDAIADILDKMERGGKMSEKKDIAAIYCRFATEQQANDSDSKYMKDWTEICQAYCDKVGAELLFVNMGDFGCAMPSGELRHIHADELAVLLATEQPFSAEPSGMEMKMW